MKKYIWGLLVVIAVIVVVMITNNQSSSGDKDLAGKNIKELSALNTPISCTKPVLASEKPAAGTATEIPTKFWILGNSIKETGVTIQTDGTAGPASANIIANNIIYTQLMDEANAGKMMAIEDQQFTQSLRDSFDTISPTSLTCTHASFDASFFQPASVCYGPTSNNKPVCIFGPAN